MPVTADRCRETTTTTGTGTITLNGAVSQHQSFANAFVTGTVVQYAIVGQGTTEWEVGYGTFTSPSTLARTTILSSSNSNTAVNFSAGTKDVFATLTADVISNASMGMELAANKGWAMP